MFSSITQWYMSIILRPNQNKVLLCTFVPHSIMFQATVTHHVTFCREDLFPDALGGHPAYRQRVLTILSPVVLRLV